MDTEHLVQMANRIAQFFEATPDRAEARAGVLQHIERFWAPRMRHDLAAHLAAGGDGLRPLVLEAFARGPGPSALG